MNKITKDMHIGDLLHMDSGLADILMSVGMHCLGCPSSQMETIEEAAMVHGFNTDDLIAKLNKHLESCEK